MNIFNWIFTILITLLSLAVVTLYIYNNFLTPDFEYSLQYEDVIDKNCLQTYANEFCEKDTSYIGALLKDNSFHCIKDNNERIKTKKLSIEFYFLDNELKDCTYQVLKHAK